MSSTTRSSYSLGPRCSIPMQRAYAVRPNTCSIGLCLDCGLGQNSVPNGSYEVLDRGRRILLSGEQLVNPTWYVTQLMSTSSSMFEQTKLLEEKLFGTAMPRNSATRGMTACIASPEVRSALSTELLYAKLILQLGSYNISGCSILVLCPLPTVASSVVTLQPGVPESVNMAGLWETTTESDNVSPLATASGSVIHGRKAETLVSISMRPA